MLYECHDEFGNLVGAYKIPTKNLETIIIMAGDETYRPISYDVGRSIATCVPVKIARVSSADLVAGGKGVIIDE
jgi:hypothetical protein